MNSLHAEMARLLGQKFVLDDIIIMIMHILNYFSLIRFYYLFLFTKLIPNPKTTLGFRNLYLNGLAALSYSFLIYWCKLVRSPSFLLHCLFILLGLVCAIFVLTYNYPVSINFMECDRINSALAVNFY